MEQVVCDLVKRQSRLFDVSVLCYASGDARTITEYRDGAKITRVSTLGSLASMPLSPALLWQLRDFEPDLIHLHTPNPLAALAMVTAAFKCPIIVEHHSDTVGRRALRFISDPFVRAVMNRADAIVATSQRYLDSSSELRPYRSKTTVVPCGIDLQETGPGVLDSAAAIQKAHGNRLIVAVGRLVPYKGFDVLIESMRSVDGNLLLIGDGPLREKLKAQIDQTGLAEKVHLLSRVPEVAPYLRAADVFVLPSVSRAEAFGLVQVEAMACGTAVVNTNIDSGVPEVSVHGLTGLTVPPCNAPELASALNLLLNSDELRTSYGEAARERVRDHFTADLMSQSILALYQHLGVCPAKESAIPEDARVGT